MAQCSTAMRMEPPLVNSVPLDHTLSITIIKKITGAGNAPSEQSGKAMDDVTIATDRWNIVTQRLPFLVNSVPLDRTLSITIIKEITGAGNVQLEKSEKQMGDATHVTDRWNIVTQRLLFLVNSVLLVKYLFGTIPDDPTNVLTVAREHMVKMMGNAINVTEV